MAVIRSISARAARWVPFVAFSAWALTLFVVYVADGVPFKPEWSFVSQHSPGIRGSDGLIASVRFGLPDFAVYVRFFQPWRMGPPSGTPDLIRWNERCRKGDFAIGARQATVFYMYRYTGVSDFDEPDGAGGTRRTGPWLMGRSWELGMSQWFVGVLLASLWLLVEVPIAARKLRRRRWAQAGACLQCGYLLRCGSGSCPECGYKTEPPPATNGANNES